jgi:dTDP-4-amino-4,6-dideoxygalactose transaminase
MIGPSPRLRLYSSPALYGEVFYALASGSAKRGEDIAALEIKIKAMVGSRNAIVMPMARVGIYLAVKHLIKRGQKVIMSPYTIADVVNMVVCAGGRPVFADIDRESCNISAGALADLIDDETGAVLVTHFYGQMAEIDAINALCAARNIAVIEDAAQAFGARLHGRAAGTFGRAGILSFGMYKNINSLYGGMILTDDDGLAARIRGEMHYWPLQAVLGFSKKLVSSLVTDMVTWPPLFKTFSFRLFRWAFLHEIDAVNNRLKIDVNPELKRSLPESYRCRMMPLQARLIMKQLKLLEPDAEKRSKAAALYHEGLSDIEQLITAPLLTDRSHIYWHFPIQYVNRKELVAHVMRQGRDITMSHHRNCATMECFREFARDCPNAQATAESLIYLPTYPRYGEDEVRDTIKAIRSYFGK